MAKSEKKLVTHRPPWRPTKYRPDMVQEGYDFIESCKDTEEQRLKSEGNASTSYDYKVRIKYPSKEGLAIHLKCTRESVDTWAKQHKDFSYMVEYLYEQQAHRLQQAGLSGDYNSSIVRLLLSKHGYVEKKEVDLKQNALEIDFDAQGQKSLDSVTPKKKL